MSTHYLYFFLSSLISFIYIWKTSPTNQKTHTNSLTIQNHPLSPTFFYFLSLSSTNLIFFFGYLPNKSYIYISGYPKIDSNLVNFTLILPVKVFTLKVEVPDLSLAAAKKGFNILLLYILKELCFLPKTYCKVPTAHG